MSIRARVTACAYIRAQRRFEFPRGARAASGARSRPVAVRASSSTRDLRGGDVREAQQEDPEHPALRGAHAPGA